ncbi:MAG TPA: serine hydrolase [Atribacteraceae bacterium]|nr:serine hydrolase [Atribacteraceae bacterium]
MAQIEMHKKNRIVLAITGVFILFLYTLSAIAAVPSEDPLAGFGEYVVETMEEWKVPGVAVVIVNNGEVVFQEGFGFRDVENALPVTEQTIFGLGSSTKAFTATLLMSLVENGILDLDWPIRQYMPFTLGDPFTASLITARDLLSHRSGLPRFDMTFLFNPELSRDELLDKLRYMMPVLGLRTTFFYSNYGYAVAGILYEEISGQTWEEGIRSRIFQSLGMSGSNLSVEEMLASPDFARGYYRENNQLREVQYLELNATAPAGAVNAGVVDLARWLLSNLDLPGESGITPLLGSASLQFMQSPVTPILGRLSPHVSHLSYGLGWMVGDYRGHYHVHHDGMVPGYSTMVSLFPDEGIGVAVVCNLNGSPLPVILANEASDRLLGLDPVDWNALTKEAHETAEALLNNLSVLDPLTRKTGTSPAHALDDFTGIFQHPLYGTFHITREDEQLTATYHRATIPLEHWHFDVFTGWVDYFIPMQLAFRFVTDIHGNLNGLEVDLDPFSFVNPITFIRQPNREQPDPEVLSRLAGEYLVMGTLVTIQITEDEKLIMTVPDQPEWHLEPLGNLSFRIRGLSGSEVQFTLAETGMEEDMITLIQPQGTFSGKRVKS